MTCFPKRHIKFIRDWLFTDIDALPLCMANIDFIIRWCKVYDVRYTLYCMKTCNKKRSRKVYLLFFLCKINSSHVSQQITRQMDFPLHLFLFRRISRKKKFVLRPTATVSMNDERLQRFWNELLFVFINLFDLRRVSATKTHFTHKQMIIINTFVFFFSTFLFIISVVVLNYRCDELYWADQQKRKKCDAQSLKCTEMIRKDIFPWCVVHQCSRKLTIFVWSTIRINVQRVKQTSRKRRQSLISDRNREIWSFR